MLTGIAMGSTAIALVFSPLGKRSGAHFNPAVTLTFWRLGKVKNWDALFYVIAQFIGGIAGVFVVALFVARMTLSHPAVNYVATLPGPHGMIDSLHCRIRNCICADDGGAPREQHAAPGTFHGDFRRCLVATYITFEAPFSGMSMNPARTFGSAFVGHLWTGLWIYFTAPVLAMQIGRNALSPQQTRSLLREISSLQSAPLHFQLPLS